MKKEIAIIKLKIIAVFLLILLSAILIPGHSEFINYSIEENCAIKLSALGAAQLTYMDSNLDKNYGSASAIQNSGILSSDVTLDNYIENYRINHFSAFIWLWQFGCPDSTFTVVAVPRNNKKFNLRTFSISDDQRVRIWHGINSQFDETDIHTHDRELWYDVSQWSKRVYGRSIQQEASSAAFKTKLFNWLRFRKSYKYRPLEKNDKSK